MKLGVLFSGGKDSTYALFQAMQKERVVCLISLKSKNPESFMFHTPNIHLAKLQAEAIGLPLVEQETAGEKEVELDDLKSAIQKAKDLYNIEGVVTGAVESIYQASRVQKICHELGLYCFNPLWKKGQVELLKELLDNKFVIIFSAILGYPLDEKWLGETLDEKKVKQLSQLQKEHHINPAGEGGEYESTVLDAPFFRKKIEIVSSVIQAKKHEGILIIKEARLVAK